MNLIKLRNRMAHHYLDASMSLQVAAQLCRDEQDIDMALKDIIDAMASLKTAAALKELVEEAEAEDRQAEMDARPVMPEMAEMAEAFNQFKDACEIRKAA